MNSSTRTKTSGMEIWKPGDLSFDVNVLRCNINERPILFRIDIFIRIRFLREVHFRS